MTGQKIDTRKHVFTVPEVAEILRISRTSAYEAARKGEIPTVRIGCRVLVPVTALERLLEQDLHVVGEFDH